MSNLPLSQNFFSENFQAMFFIIVEKFRYESWLLRLATFVIQVVGIGGENSPILLKTNSAYCLQKDIKSGDYKSKEMITKLLAIFS
jgi:hypothetical protein